MWLLSGFPNIQLEVKKCEALDLGLGTSYLQGLDPICSGVCSGFNPLFSWGLFWETAGLFGIPLAGELAQTTGVSASLFRYCQHSVRYLLLTSTAATEQLRWTVSVPLLSSGCVGLFQPRHSALDQHSCYGAVALDCFSPASVLSCVWLLQPS